MTKTKSYLLTTLEILTTVLFFVFVMTFIGVVQELNTSDPLFTNLKSVLVIIGLIALVLSLASLVILFIIRKKVKIYLIMFLTEGGFAITNIVLFVLSCLL